MRRILEIIFFGVRSYLDYKNFNRSKSAPESRFTLPKKFVDEITKMGPTFIKMGQVLSTRPDVLPDAYISELKKLQENVPTFSSEESRFIVETDFGKPIQEIYREFQSDPVASASLSQVHFAELHDGTPVAVKIQRPGITNIIKEDMQIFSTILKVFNFFFPRFVRRTNILNAFEEFKRYTLRELDFIQEAKVIERFRINFSTWKDVVCPIVYWDYTSDRILTMQRLYGMRLHDAVEQLSNPEKEKLCRRIAEIELKMFISDALFHADLHPGNIFFGKEGTISLLDFGMYGELSIQERDNFVLYWLAVVQNEVRKAFYYFKRQCRELPGANEELFYKKFKDMAEQFYSSRLVDASLTKVYINMIKAGYKYGFLFPSNLLLHAKALTTAESLSFALAPDMRFEEITRPIIAREFARLTIQGPRLLNILEKNIPEMLLLGQFSTQADLYKNEKAAGGKSFFWDAIYERIILELRNWEKDAQLFKSLLNPYVSLILNKNMSPKHTEKILDRAWEMFTKMEPEIAPQSTMGATVNMHLAAATIAIYRSLLEVGCKKDQAATYIYDIGWKIYSRMGEWPMIIAGIFSSDPRKKMELATQMFRWVPFGPPAYEWEDVDADDKIIAFNCTKCPIADYFSRFQLSWLCYQTWCKLDFPLAEQWGGRLDRSNSIAGGAKICDFRWNPGSR